jgi:hypothetical protein
MQGTRQKQTFSDNHQAATQDNGKLTRDVGLSKRATGSFTFAASTGRISGSNGTFSAFAVNDPVTIYGTNLNNGDREVIAVAGNGSYIQVDLPVKDEGPVTAEVRLS